LNCRILDLRELIGQGVELLRQHATNRKVSLEVTLPADAVPLMGDHDRLQQVMTNLVSNAIKFTPEGGQVCVTLERSEDTVRLVVQDTGKGIRPEFLPHVFERFRQADSSSTRSEQGLGLGLAIVQHLVALHGGSVRADSAGVGRGATFTVELPTKGVINSMAPEAGKLPATPGVLDLKGMTVLVLDDELDARESIVMILRSAQCEVVSANSAGKAFEILRTLRPDVIISDIAMPDCDGCMFIEKLRADESHACRNTPAVALSAYARVEDAQRAMAAGFNAHIAKPVEPAALLAEIAQFSHAPLTRMADQQS
jgi:CheY-like chemotaxis protein